MRSVSQLSISLFLFVTLAIGLADETQANPTRLRRGGSENVLHFELLNAVTTTAESTTPQPRSGNQAVSFHALGRQFDLQLEPNELFAPGAHNTWVGDGSSKTEASTTIFYKGQIKGEPGSWVRVSLRNGVMDGMIRSKDEIYFVEPGKRFFTSPSPHNMVIYRQSDTVSDWEPGSCALEQPEVGAAMESHATASAPSSDYDALRAELQALAGGTLEQIDIALVADYEYASRHGANAAADMQNIINQVDGIYKAELGVKLRIATTVVFTTPSDPFSGTTDPGTLLNEFSTYKGGSASAVRSAGLAHLFTGRSLAGSTVGIAWLGTACHPSYGAGVSEDFTSANQALVILTAHEMGHNLNAPHDNQSGSPCASTPQGFVMNPWVDANFNHFSSCSKSQVAPIVSAASCFVTVADSSCSYAISPSSATVGAPLSTGTVAVITTSGCAWTAVSSASWLTVNLGASGTGNGTVTYTVSPNLGTGTRTGTLTIAGQTFTVTQAGVPPCVSSLLPLSSIHSASAESGAISISTTGSCSWTATSSANWIAITSATSGVGNGTVTYTAAANTSTNARTGTVTIGGQTFTVTQAGLPPVCSITLPTTSRLHRALISKSQIRVKTLPACSWAATSHANWITILTNPTGYGTKSIRYEVAPNPTFVPRTGIITVGGQAFTVNQKALIP